MAVSEARTEYFKPYSRLVMNIVSGAGLCQAHLPEQRNVKNRNTNAYRTSVNKNRARLFTVIVCQP